MSIELPAAPRHSRERRKTQIEQTLWANAADNTLMIFYFIFLFQKTGFDIADSLHEMSKPVFLENKNKKKHFRLSSAEKFTQSAKR